MERSNEPYVELNPEPIKQYGITEYVIIETNKGNITQRVKPNPDLDPRIVYAAFGWNQANLNELTSWDTELCEAMGAVTHRGIPCRIHPESQNK
jgi:anaerobic selenocysteine-containing dehydrogenase